MNPSIYDLAFRVLKSPEMRASDSHTWSAKQHGYKGADLIAIVQVMMDMELHGI